MPVADVLDAVQDHINRAPAYDLYRDYEEGRHRYPYASSKFRETFRWVLEQARSNSCYTVRANFTDLVQIQSWSGAGAEQAELLDETTDLDMVIDLTVNEAFRCGDGYVLVWPGKDGQKRPWYHRADQAGFKLDPEDPSQLAVAWKIWVNGDGFGRVNLYYPERLERWGTTGRVRIEETQAISWDGFKQENAWEPYNADGEPEEQSHDFGRVPWVHIPFDAQSQGGHGRSILRDVIPLQDGLNHAVHAVVVNTEQYAAPLRSLMNHEPVVSIDPATGRQVEEKIKVDPTRNSVFAFRGAGPFQQHNPPDSGAILDVKRDWNSDIANVVGIPVSDIVPDLGNVPSGAALRILASRRTNLVRNFTSAAAGRIAQLMELLGVPDARPEFVDPAPMDETERLTSAQAKLDMGYPLSEVLPDLGEDPADIERILEAIGRQEATVGRTARRAFEQGQSTAAMTGASDIKSRADAMGVLIRAGVDPEDAAQQVGLDVDFTGAVPTSLRLPESDAGRLEAT